MARERNKKPNRGKRLLLVLAFLVLLVGMGMLLAYRSGILDKVHGGKEIISKIEPYTFETGTQQLFAPMKGGFAVGSTTGLQVLDKSGVTVVRGTVSITTPALVSCDSRAAVYDVGGTVLRVGDLNGELTVLDTKDKIISVTMNETGFLAVVTEETGYKGLVTVYNKDLEPVYRWHSGTNYVLSARVDPNGKTMAALTLEETGSAVHLFSLQSETEQAAYHTQGLLLFDLAFLSGDRLCAVHDDGLVFFDAGGADGGSWSFGGQFLSDYSFGGDGFVTVMLSQYQSGSGGTVATVGYGGLVTGQMDPLFPAQSLSVRDKQVLIRYGEYTAVYSQSLEETAQRNGGQGAKDALLTGKNKGYLLYSGYCEPVTY